MSDQDQVPAVPAGYDLPVNSPELPTDSGVVMTRKAFSDGLTLDLTDSEISQALRITLPIKEKWSAIFVRKLNSGQFTVDQAMKLVDQFEDELVTTLATKMDLIATVDASPVFEGQPLIVDFVGALDSHYTANYGFDHEKKAWEVQRANLRGEDFLGSRESVNNAAKARDKAERNKASQATTAIKPIDS
jgi:hypothetical protein